MFNIKLRLNHQNNTNVRSQKIAFSNQKDVYPSCILSQGRERLLIELDEKEGINPNDVNKYEIIEKYQNLVSDIAEIVAELIEGKTGIEKEEAFITEVWGLMNSNLKIRFGTNKFGFLYESLQTNEFDCDNSSFLVYDIAKELSIKAQIVLLNGHVLIKINNFYFETTSGVYFKNQNYLEEEYSWYQILNEDQIQLITYNNRGNAKEDLKDFKGAIEDYNKAIELNPKDADVYYNRGNAKFKLGQYEEAIEDYNKAIELNPKDAGAYYNRGNVKFKLGQYEEAIEDYNKAIKLNPNYVEAYYNRRIAQMLYQ